MAIDKKIMVKIKKVLTCLIHKLNRLQFIHCMKMILIRLKEHQLLQSQDIIVTFDFDFLLKYVRFFRHSNCS